LSTRRSGSKSSIASRSEKIKPFGGKTWEDTKTIRCFGGPIPAPAALAALIGGTSATEGVIGPVFMPWMSTAAGAALFHPVPNFL